uniref:KIB1-4 beta-propeller domain-containing protein n=1 Tax=Trifolium pratense TaxID=57577 RepID=A0A2K3JU87_TRIPR
MNGPVHVWEKRGCTIIDPKQQFMKFGTAIAYQGKIYALSMQGMIAVIEVIGTDVAITAISKCRAVPSVIARYFRECLIESNGEILLVFLIFQKTMTIVDHVEVFKLQVPKLRWVKMEELEDRALFVEPESCIWVKASQFGCKSNCVSFSTTIDEWWTYDLKSYTISSRWSKNELHEEQVISNNEGAYRNMN